MQKQLQLFASKIEMTVYVPKGVEECDSRAHHFHQGSPYVRRISCDCRNTDRHTKIRVRYNRQLLIKKT